MRDYISMHEQDKHLLEEYLGTLQHLKWRPFWQ